MNFSSKIVCTGLIAITALAACKQKSKKPGLERFTANNAAFVIDESFRPIVDEELYVFKNTFTKTSPKTIYLPENQVMSLLLNDSVRIAVTSRVPDTAETRVFKSRNLHPIITPFAQDAVALIVNQASNDTTITVSELKKMLTGDNKSGKNIVFDNPNSSLVRYLKEFSGAKDFKQKSVYSLKSNKEVIKYVSEHPDAIGITGFSWLNDPDKDYADAVGKVKIMSVRDDTRKNASTQYYSPSQETLALKQYPLSRRLYILNFTGKLGLGMEFAAFVAGDRGQRIILKSGLLPDSIPQREINIVSKFKQ